MKKLFIYYSLTGNGDVIADLLKEKGYEIRKVIPKDSLPKNFFLSMMIGGFKAFINMKDELIDFNSDIADYDKIVIGSPVWNDRISSPINTVLSKLEINNKDLSFVLYSASGKASRASEKIRKYNDADIVVLKSPKDNKEELNKININYK